MSFFRGVRNALIPTLLLWGLLFRLAHADWTELQKLDEAQRAQDDAWVPPSIGNAVVVLATADGLRTASVLAQSGTELNPLANVPLEAFDRRLNGKERTWSIIGAGVCVLGGPVGLVVGRVIRGLTIRHAMRRRTH